jgi:hypothetical protein
MLHGTPTYVFNNLGSYCVNKEILNEGDTPLVSCGGTHYSSWQKCNTSWVGDRFGTS